ncbi:hypothetical protein RND81_07G008500 [Saponaria officinalis]|uniref:HMA domain-containing protein n=1 Tax=Saponaria officinalis TaxID=3572 RepID=A0AAW1JLT5_SAPOF
MGKKRTQLKIVNSGKRNSKDILSAVARIEGVEKLEMDVNKAILTVVGEVEPVLIFMALKKICVKSEIVSVGPPKPERPNDQQQPWRHGPAPSCQYGCSSYCQQVSVGCLWHHITQVDFKIRKFQEDITVDYYVGHSVALYHHA